jgi:hypothetical protein
MQIEWVYGLFGGLIIGIAGSILLLFNGRIMGASGIIGGLVDGSGRTRARENIALILGLILAPAVFVWGAGMTGETHLINNWAVIIGGGLLVGVGTRLANGCTSGHGVCGISRLSIRGIVATVFYIAAGAATVVALRYVGGMI